MIATAPMSHIRLKYLSPVKHDAVGNTWKFGLVLLFLNKCKTFSVALFFLAGFSCENCKGILQKYIKLFTMPKDQLCCSSSKGVFLTLQAEVS